MNSIRNMGVVGDTIKPEPDGDADAVRSIFGATTRANDHEQMVAISDSINSSAGSSMPTSTSAGLLSRPNASPSPDVDVDTMSADESTNENEPKTNPKTMDQSQESKPSSSYEQPPPKFVNLYHNYNDNDLLKGLSSWEWVVIDGLYLPAVTRNSEHYVAVHIVQLKLLSKFPSNIPREIIEKFTMSAHKMTTIEAWTFNSINAVIRKFDLGFQLFTSNDELVKLNDVQMFYWNVKKLNLQRISAEYEKEIKGAENNVNLIATIMTLKQQVDNDIQVISTEIERKQLIMQQTSQEELHSAISRHSTMISN